VHPTTTRPKITVTADGAAVVSHAGTRLLADLADTTTLTAELSDVLDGARGPRPRHDPGRVLVDLAVAIADGAESISDIAVLADQPALFGPVASDSTCWRLLAALDERRLSAVTGARARAREAAWAQRAETTGAAFGPSRVAGTAGLDALVIDLDAHVLVCHSDVTARRSRPRQRSSTPSATTRCWPSWTTPGSSSPRPCGRATPGRTPLPTTSLSSTPHSPRSPTVIGTGIRS
jgi:hypothetical protein